MDNCSRWPLDRRSSSIAFQRPGPPHRRSRTAARSRARRCALFMSHRLASRTELFAPARSSFHFSRQSAEVLSTPDFCGAAAEAISLYADAAVSTRRGSRQTISSKSSSARRQAAARVGNGRSAWRRRRSCRRGDAGSRYASGRGRVGLSRIVPTTIGALDRAQRSLIPLRCPTATPAIVAPGKHSANLLK